MTGDDNKDPECETCDDLHGIAVHMEASKQYGIKLLTPHRVDSKIHPVRDCPDCDKRAAQKLAVERHHEIGKLTTRVGDLEEENQKLETECADLRDGPEEKVKGEVQGH